MEKDTKKRKVNVVYGDKKLVDCMKNVILKRKNNRKPASYHVYYKKRA